MGECCRTPSKFNKVINSIEVASSSGNNVLRSPVSALLVVKICAKPQRNLYHKNPLVFFSFFKFPLLLYFFFFFIIYTKLYSISDTSGITTKAANNTDITKLTQNSQRRNVKYDATTVPNWDSISLMVSSQGIIWLITLAISRLLCCHCYKYPHTYIYKYSRQMTFTHQRIHGLTVLSQLLWPRLYETEPKYPVCFYSWLNALAVHPRAS